jgi:hypothetical protein
MLILKVLKPALMNVFVRDVSMVSLDDVIEPYIDSAQSWPDIFLAFDAWKRLFSKLRTALIDTEDCMIIRILSYTKLRRVTYT